MAKIQRDVLQQQQETEEDLAKAEPAVEAAMSALDTLDQKDLTSCKGMLKPPPRLNEVFAATMCLLAGVMPSIVLKKNGQVKDTSWDAAKKQLMGNIQEYMTYLKEIKSHVDCNTINHINFREVRQYIQQDYFNVEAIKANLIAQLTAPVRWTQTVENMVSGGASEFVECGPGRVLQGLVKKVHREAVTSGIA